MHGRQPNERNTQELELKLSGYTSRKCDTTDMSSIAVRLNLGVNHPTERDNEKDVMFPANLNVQLQFISSDLTQFFLSKSQIFISLF